ncbi:MAG: hypothetical protein AAF327_01200 [Cyanobacteria bacterium P01_A01_bin.37]
MILWSGHFEYVMVPSFRSLFHTIADPFHEKKRLNVALLLIYSVINGLVFFNAWHHDSAIGYDAYAHTDYIEAFAQLRLVTPEDSYEFFSPPLPYVIPAWAIAFGNVTVERAEKIAQLFNVLLSLGLTYFLLKICDRVHSSAALKLGTLMSLGLLPVYYKTFAYVRGEPYVAFFAVVAIYLTLLIFQLHRATLGYAVLLGITLGALALSRQWGILLYPALGLFMLWQGWIYRFHVWPFARAIAIISVITFLVSSWFYLGLRSEYGQATAFNRVPQEQFSFQNQPASFYFDLSVDEILTDPIRGNFPNRFFPIFYSEIWGDYWGYFSVYGKDTRTNEYVAGLTLSNTLQENSGIPDWLETNRLSIAPYLGRVNGISLFPTAIMVLSVVFSSITVIRRLRTNPMANGKDAIQSRHQRDTLLLLLLAIATSLGGYAWFLIMYPNLGKGDTIKATYTLQVFPLLSILTGYLLFQLKTWKPMLFFLVLFLWAGIWVHNLPSMVTHYPLLH